MKTFKEQLHFLKGYFERRKKTAVIALSFVFISTALDQASPWVIKLVVDHLEAGGDLQGALTYLAILAGLSIVGAVLLFFQRYLLISASRDVEYQLRNDLFRIFQEQPKKFYQKYRVGDLMSRATNDLDHVRDLIGPAVLHSFRMILLFVYTAIMMSLLSPLLAVVGLGLALLLPILSLKFMKVIYAIYAANQKFLGQLNTYVQESFSNISVIKSFNRRTYFADKFEERSENFKKSSTKVAWTTSLIWPTIGLIGGLGICATIYAGTIQVTKGEISLGDLSAAVLYLVRVQFPLVGLGWVISLVQRGRSALDRIMNVIDTAKSFEDEEKTSFEPAEYESLELENASLTIENQTLLENISLSLPKGKTLGLVGETGSGKTLLTHLLCGIYPPNTGALKINQIDATQRSLKSLKSHFSIAPQDGFLFSISIRHNIELGSDTPRGLSVEEAAELACLSKDLDQITDGLDAMLGEKGINLSGGQKQRVGLSRALYANSPILVLDDTLSALDTETEKQVLKNLRSHFPDQTKVIVAHRYSTVMACDEILYLENGKILERGNHESLLLRNGRYASTWKRQQIQMEESSYE